MLACGSCVRKADGARCRPGWQRVVPRLQPAARVRRAGSSGSSIGGSGGAVGGGADGDAIDTSTPARPPPRQKQQQQQQQQQQRDDGGRRRQRGAAYHERYLANRRRRGGELLPLPSAGDGEGEAPHERLLRAIVARAVEEGRLMAPPPLERPRDAAERLGDRVPDAEVPALLERLRQPAARSGDSGGGVFIAPPTEPLFAADAPHALPAVRGVEAARARGARVELHAFWDVASATHPRALDPRLVAARLRAVCRAIAGEGDGTGDGGGGGAEGGLYVYGSRRLFAWLPEAFMRRYAPLRLPASQTAAAIAAVAEQQQQQGQQQQQQQQQQPSGGAPAAQSNATLPPGARVKCPVCGQTSSDYAALRRHMRQQHRRAAPPPGELELVAPRTAAAAAAAAAAASPAPAGRQTPAVDVEALAAAWDGAVVNSSGRTLGRVAAYAAADGALYAPRAAGGAASLKYALAREGWSPRVVAAGERRDDGAADASVAAAIDALLADVEARRSDGGGGDDGDDESSELPHLVIVVASDSRAHAGALARARTMFGASTVAICDRLGAFGEADVLLRWRLVAGGRYRLPP